MLKLSAFRFYSAKLFNLPNVLSLRLWNHIAHTERDPVKWKIDSAKLPGYIETQTKKAKYKYTIFSSGLNPNITLNGALCNTSKHDDVVAM